jgi:transcriptional regulator GlxA family with amidase domain
MAIRSGRFAASRSTRGGFSAFHDFPATSFVDTIVDGEEVWDEGARELYSALKPKRDADQCLDTIEAFLLRHLRHRPDEDRVLRGVAAQIACGTPVSEVRKKFGLSQRSLHALFDRRIGVRPKLFARLEPFTAALDATPDRRSWCDLAAEEGFSDQAHLVREFHAFSGSPPSRHVMVEGETRHAEPAADKIFNTEGGA